MLEVCGKNIILREFTEENLQNPAYFNWIRDPYLMKMIRFEYLLPIAHQEIIQYVRTLIQSKTDGFFAVYTKETQEFIGTQKIGHIDWRTGTADIGILIGHPAYRGKGLSYDIISTACNYAFSELGLRKLTAGTPASNVAMIKCFEKIGFVEEGTLRKNLLISGEFVDHKVYGVFKNEFLHE